MSGSAFEVDVIENYIYIYSFISSNVPVPGSSFARKFGSFLRHQQISTIHKQSHSHVH